MPAVTADPLTLPRLTRPSEVGTAWRPVHKVVTARRQVEGEGFVVRRPFPGMDLALADPFLLLDHMGAVEYGPGEAKGAPWHPHRGFETVTYMIDGAGILHSELPPQEMVAKGGLFHGVQLWVNLPAAQKWTPPAYQDITAADVTLLTSDDGGALVRLIAGSLGGFVGPGVTQTPIAYAHVTLSPGASLATAWPADFNALAYVLSGRGYAGPQRRPLDEGQLAVFGPGDALVLQAADAQPQAASAGWDVLLLGGLPLREPVARYGPFVMNTRSEIIQAVEDYQAGRLGTIPPTSRHLLRMAHRTAADERDVE